MARQIRPPELEGLILTGIRLTGTNIGGGAYGSVEEVEISETVVAAKKLHPQLVDLGSEEQVKKWTSDFVGECILMSQLRHPNIVQFLGVCYLPESKIPVLVMERLQISLDSLLETTSDIHLDIKLHFLVGICQGVVYLHNRGIVHRDLTARNILIDSGLTAKIADLGVARMVNIQPGQIAATMTSTPGTGLYMPPEATGEDRTARYGTTIDIFSFGVISLFTAIQIFPNDIKPATYFDSVTGKIVGRSEIERREKYIATMKKMLGDVHPLVQLTLRCLQFQPDNRPSSGEALIRLRKIAPKSLAQTKLKTIQEKKQEIIKIREDCEKQVSLTKHENAILMDKMEHLQNENKAKVNDLEARIRDLEDNIGRLQDENKELATKCANMYSQKGSTASSTPDDKTSITFEWKRGRDIPKGVHLYGQPVSLNGKLYISAKRGFATGAVLQYTPSSDEWSQLPAPSVYNFSIATFNGELLVVGGTIASSGKATDKILVYCENKWIPSSFKLPKPLAIPVVFEYGGKLLVIGGDDKSDKACADVSVFNPKTKWRPLQSLPGAVHYKHAMHEDFVCLVADRTSKYVKYVHLPCLLTGALNAWETRPEVSLYHTSPIIIGKRLFTIGGSTDEIGYRHAEMTAKINLFDPTSKEWKEVGSLPKPVVNCCCTVFSNKLFVLGLDGATYVTDLIN